MNYIIKNFKKGYLFAALIVVGLLTLFFVFRYLSNKSNSYFALFPNVKGLEVNDPVVVDNIQIGDVKKIFFHEDKSGVPVVKLNISKRINIPSLTIASISNSQISEGKEVTITVRPSSEYLKNGDTIQTEDFLFSVDSLIELSTKVNRLLLESNDMSYDNKTLQRKEGEKIIFKVQILVSKDEIDGNSERFKGVKGIERIREGVFFKYYTGKKYKFSEVKNLKDSLKKIGFKDAFVVAYKGGVKISVQDANMLLKN